MSMKSTSLARLLSVEVPGQANILTQILHLFHRLNECFKIEIGFIEPKLIGSRFRVPGSRVTTY